MKVKCYLSDYLLKLDKGEVKSHKFHTPTWLIQSPL